MGDLFVHRCATGGDILKPAATLRNQNGQIIIEIVLMLTVTMAIVLAVSTAAQSNEWFAGLVSGPWQDLASIIQNGVPCQAGGQCAANNMAAEHPNNFSRVTTPKSSSWAIQ